LATPTVSLAQVNRIAGDGTLAVDPQSARPTKTPIMKCCQCESVASSQFQLAFQLFNLDWNWQHWHIGNNRLRFAPPVPLW